MGIDATGTDWVNAIEVRNLIKHYPHGTRPALKGLSLQVAKGEFFGLLGKNGAGKTTLVSILCGMLDEYEGSAAVAGCDLAQGFDPLRSRIGIVPQNLALYEDLTPRENLSYFGGLYRLQGAVLRERVAECLRMTNLETRADTRVSRLSGGMQRLANLAAALVHKPEILFLDEPTLGIDVHTRKDIIEVLAQLNRQGMTLLFTTHYMGEVQDYFSKVAIIDEGALLAHGSIPELRAAYPRCRDLEELFFTLTGGYDKNDEAAPAVFPGKGGAA